MASQVQIPFEGVILQEHSVPISCPTPNFAKGSSVQEIRGGTQRVHETIDILSGNGHIIGGFFQKSRCIEDNSSIAALL